MNAERVRRLYDRAAPRYDRAARARLLEELRARAFSLARGHVLELGAGTGATFAHYPADLTSLTAVDVSGGMLAHAHAKSLTLPFPVTFRQLDYQTLPFPDASFDTVVSSLGLCGIPDPPHLFADVKRVLRQEGQLLAVEHVRPSHPTLALVTDLIDPAFEHFAGCHANRATPTLLRAAGFRVDLLDQRFAGILVALRAVYP